MRKRQILHHSYGMNDTMYERYKAANNESYWTKTTDNRILYEDYISFLQSRHSSMEGIARHKYRQNLSGDSDWIDFMMFGIQLLQELLHWLLYSYWCVILLRSHTDSLHWRGKDMKLHLTSQQLLDYYHEILLTLAPLPGTPGRDPNSLLCRATLTGLKYSKAGTNSSTSYI